MEETLARLPAPTKVVDTPVPGATFETTALDESRLAAVSIIRAGDSLLDSVREAVPDIAVGKILIQRDESTEEKLPKLFYSKLPACIADGRPVLVVDPMLATGGSAVCAINVRLRYRVARALAHPPAAHTHPRTRMLSAAGAEGRWRG